VTPMQKLEAPEQCARILFFGEATDVEKQFFLVFNA
jgi:hypothetical protein